MRRQAVNFYCCAFACLIATTFALDSLADDVEPAEPSSEVVEDSEAMRKRLFSIPPWEFGRILRIPRAPRFGDQSETAFSDRVNDALRPQDGRASLFDLNWTLPLEDLTFGGTYRRSGTRDSFDGGVIFRLDGADISTDSMVHDESNSEIRLEGDVRATEDDASLTAEHLHFERPEPTEEEKIASVDPALEYEPVRHPLVPHGYVEEAPSGPAFGLITAESVHLEETGRSLVAESLDYDVNSRSGEFVETSGHVGPLYFSARRLRVLGPADILGEDIWVTTCDRPVPHYRIRMKRAAITDDGGFRAEHARLEVGRAITPFYLPRVGRGTGDNARHIGTDLEIGSRAEVGFYMNVAPWFRMTDNFKLAPRVFATTSSGTGFGFDGEYDFMSNPRSSMFRSKGSFHTLYTTEDRGYTEAYHRQELTKRTVLLAQWEQWYDSEFVKDFYNEVFEDRTGPRSFLNITHTRPGQIVTGTVATSTHNFTTESEKLPEMSYHLIERRLGKGFYGTFDGAAGYYDSVPGGIDSGRAITMGRLTYDWNVASGFNVTPFVEADATWYSDTLGDGSAFRGTVTGGATAQARFQRAYPGRWGFNGFKHIVLPSVTMSHRPDSSLNAEDTPVYDGLDYRPGRTRVSSTVDNVLLGQNAETGVVWPVARLTLFQGNDLSHEVAESQDYEAQVQIRPRPWWGFHALAEAHSADATATLLEEDLDRGMAFLFYDNRHGKNTLNARVGFAVTESSTTIYNQEILYGAGYKLTENWSFGAEHRYDIERNTLVRQSYEIRRRLHKWEMAFRIRDRDSGLDVGFEFNLTDFPGARIGF